MLRAVSMSSWSSVLCDHGSEKGDHLVLACVYAEEGLLTSEGFGDMTALGFPLGDFEGNTVPVDPALRCEIDTPWLARRPEKLCRFITPAKPLPLLVPITSTYWPGTKCAAESWAPTSRTASSA